MLSRSQIFLTVLALVSLVAAARAARQWGDIQLFPSSRIPESALSPLRRVVRSKILLYHNFFRTKVRPTASNMLNMSWHGVAARQAQAHAERCVFLQHNPRAENTVPRLGECGQNIFVSTGRTPCYSGPVIILSEEIKAFFAIKSWFLEYRNFTYGEPEVNLKAVGHYTQMVWATSFKVGCGLARCQGGPWGHFYNYVCHYCPGGNYDTITQYPYKAGPPCADCPEHCIAGALCANYCPHTDVYDNCKELLTYGDDQLCGRGYCNASCACGDDKIYRNHPW